MARLCLVPAEQAGALRPLWLGLEGLMEFCRAARPCTSILLWRSVSELASTQRQ